MSNLFNEKPTDYTIEILKHWEKFALDKHEDGYYGAFSGGKDSCVIKRCAEMAGIKVKWYYHAAIDPPELYNFILKEHPDVNVTKLKTPFIDLICKNGLPTRRQKWCCRLIKEHGGDGRFILTGVRAQESSKRSKRKFMEYWRKDGTRKWVVNPVLHWSEQDVWDFIKKENIPYCKLYDEGWRRLGCIGCPENTNRHKQFKRWPKTEKMWKKGLQKLWDRGPNFVKKFDNVDDVWDWWLSNGSSEKQETSECTIF